MHVGGSLPFLFHLAALSVATTPLILLSAASYSIAETYLRMGISGVSKFYLIQSLKMPPFPCLPGQTWDCLPELDDLCFESFDGLDHMAVLGIRCVLGSPELPHPANTEYFQPSQILVNLTSGKQLIDNF